MLWEWTARNWSPQPARDNRRAFLPLRLRFVRMAALGIEPDGYLKWVEPNCTPVFEFTHGMLILVTSGLYAGNDAAQWDTPFIVRLFLHPRGALAVDRRCHSNMRGIDFSDPPANAAWLFPHEHQKPFVADARGSLADFGHDEARSLRQILMAARPAVSWEWNRLLLPDGPVRYP